MPVIHLGYEVGGGAPVEVPLRHMVVTGQTQEAGKTTTLEAMIGRAGVKAVAFVTKRGEGSFAEAQIVPPYFREQADWQFVASILEASRGEKMRFERAWIMRAAKGARSLADVQRNVRQLMGKAKRSMDADMYMVLDAYLEVVVPQIEAVEWSKRVTLSAGLNVMDLTALNVEMQHLVIRSTVGWVLDHESDTVVVIPEAWKFIPQGRGTPVKLAAESYIRQAAGLRNYLWLDSQDIAGVEKIILKSVPVWLLGVQRESNEIKRTLAQIPAGIKKPKPEAIATLGLGEFFACWGTTVTKVYVQPAWMTAADAQKYARGELRQTPAAPPVVIPPSIPIEDTVKESEARELRDENSRLRRRIEELEALSSNAKAPGRSRSQDADSIGDAGSTPVGAIDEDSMYQRFKQRLVKESPALLRVLASKPELEVTVKRETITAKGDSWVGKVAQLIADGYFDTPRKSSEVFKEAQRQGMSGVAPRADEACKKLWAMGFLTREDAGFQAVDGMKVNIVEAD